MYDGEISRGDLRGKGWQQGWECQAALRISGSGSGIQMSCSHDSTASLFAYGACQIHSVLP